MICHLGTACNNKAVETVKIDDWRTGFTPKEVPACKACLDDQPALLAEHEEWESRASKRAG